MEQANFPQIPALKCQVQKTEETSSQRTHVEAGTTKPASVLWTIEFESIFCDGNSVQ